MILQHTVVHLQCTRAHCNALQCKAALVPLHCNALQRTATHGNAQQRTATHGNAPQRTARTATHSNALVPRSCTCPIARFTQQCAATYCNTLQHIATHDPRARICPAAGFTLHNALLHTIAYCHTRMCTVADCNTLQRTTTYHSTLHVSLCNTLHHPFCACLRKSKAFPAFFEFIFTDMAYLIIAYAHRDCNALQLHCNTLHKHSVFDGCPHAQRLQHTATHCNALLQHTGKHFTIIACNR